jgi:YbbR domain-containing protein
MVKINYIKRQLFNKKVITFFICLLLASLLWLVNAINRDYQYTLKIPVKFLNLPSDKIVIGEIPDKLEVTIKTSGLKLLLIRSRKLNTDLVIDFNILKSNAKSQAYNIGNGNILLKPYLDFDVNIIKIRPDTLFFSSDLSKSKIVPVKLNSNIDFEKGYELLFKPIINPSFVTITGDSISLCKIDTVYTSVLNLKNLKQNFSSEIQLKKSISNVNYSQKSVSISISVDRFTENTLFIPISIINNSNNKKVKLLPDQIEIKYSIAMSNFSNVDKSSFKAIVDFNKMTSATKQLDVELVRIPSDIKIISISPQKISFLKYK